jgi:predicted RNase H-like HicB family nuclease
VALLTTYLEGAMRQASYEQMADGSWWGSIPGFKGLWADGPGQDECQRELRSALEDWIVFSLRREQPIPIVDGIDLTIAEVA